MKLITYSLNRRVQPGAVRDEFVVPLDIIASDLYTLIQAGPRAWDQARRLMDAGRGRILLSQVTLLAPIPRPHKNIFCVGRNYPEHAKESARTRRELAGPPTIFTKAPTTVSAPYGEIVIDPKVSEQIDWEVELAVIIGKRGRKITRTDAGDYIFGYTVLNDVTARDLQTSTGQWHIGKSIDGYCPMGPWIVTKDEIPDPQNLNLTCRVNGVLKQEGNTGEMIHGVLDLVENLTRPLTLEPGDIIATGTPPGVGFARQPPEYLKPGDVMESQVEKIGTLRNKVVGV